MIIGLASLALSSVLAFGAFSLFFNFVSHRPDILCAIIVIRWMLIKENKKLDADELGDMSPEKRERIEDAARLEGLTMEEALERNRGFRYLY